MMESKHSNFAARDDGTRGLPGSDQRRARDDRFTERIRAFEQCCTSGSAGITDFLRLAAADLFRSIPLLEDAVVDDLKEAVENPLEYKRTALRQYMRTIQVLRRALEASGQLEAHPNAMNIQSQNTKQDPS